MIAHLRRVRREYLGLNRRNHDYLFRHNPRDRYRLVDDKLATKAVLAAHGVPTPPLLARCEQQGDIGALRPRLEAWGEFVLKPARGAGGGGIVVVVGRRGDAFVKASGATLTWPVLATHAADVLAGVFSLTTQEDALLVEGLIVPAAELRPLSYGGVPDLRILVFRGVPLLAMLRLPTRRSDGRANLHLGGIGVGVDLDAGRTTFGLAGRKTVTRHPDVDLPVGGLVIPAWEATLLLATRAADAVGLGFVGVDVVLDAHRGPLVLELNARPGLAIQQANRRGLRPLLDAVARATVPAEAAARVAFGRALARGQGCAGAGAPARALAPGLSS